MEIVQKSFLGKSALTDSRVNPTFTPFLFVPTHLMSLAEKESYTSRSLAAEKNTRRERTCQLAIFNTIEDPSVPVLISLNIS